MVMTMWRRLLSLILIEFKIFLEHLIILVLNINFARMPKHLVRKYQVVFFIVSLCQQIRQRQEQNISPFTVIRQQLASCSCLCIWHVLCTVVWIISHVFLCIFEFYVGMTDPATSRIQIYVFALVSYKKRRRATSSKYGICMMVSGIKMSENQESKIL